jgi:hypothetical protein
MQNEEIDYFGNIYQAGQEIALEGNAILMIAEFLTEVVAKETNLFAPFTYAIKAYEVKGKDGEVVKVDSEYKDHTKDSFMMSAVSENGGQLGLTPTGLKATQILNALLAKHAQNIEKGLTVTKQQRTEIDAFK